MVKFSQSVRSNEDQLYSTCIALVFGLVLLLDPLIKITCKKNQI